MNYQQKLSPWTIVHLQPDLRYIPVARFRRHSDAEGHLLVLKQIMPQAQFTIIFESRSDAADPPPVSSC